MRYYTNNRSVRRSTNYKNNNKINMSITFNKDYIEESVNDYHSWNKKHHCKPKIPWSWILILALILGATIGMIHATEDILKLCATIK